MSKERRIVALVLAAMAVLATLVIITAWPGDQEAHGVVDAQVVDAPVHVMIVIESIDPSRGTVRLSMNAQGAGDELGPNGATLVTDIAGLAPIVLPRDAFAAPVTAETSVDSGDVSEYPFDRYPLTIVLGAFRNEAAPTAPSSIGDVPVPLTIEVLSTVNGFDAGAGAVTVEDGVTTLELSFERKDGTMLWAVAMMLIYWLLATSAVAVAVAILAGVRPFETRHLAWLTAIIFAFAAFRNTAPGSPPIGVFLDFAAFFWAVGLVVIAELLILGYYLFSKRDTPG